MSAYSSHTDEQLIALLHDSNEAAFNELYRRYWLSLYDEAYKRLSDHEQAEDIIQDIFIRLWIRRDNLEIHNISGYLHTAVRYSVLSYITRHKSTFSFFEPFETILKETELPDEKLMAKELLNLVYLYAETLSDRRKQIFLLYVKNRLSTKEIAETLDITQKSVQNQLGTALGGLRKLLIPIILWLVTLHT